MKLKVALSGLGGDELFASYPSFGQLPRLVRYCAPLAGFPALGRGVRRLVSPLVSRLTSPKYAGMLEYGQTLGSAYLLRRCLFAPWELAGTLDPDLAQAGLAELQSVSRLDATTRRTRRSAGGALECWYMRNQLLRDAGWAGMAQSLEIGCGGRLPLLREAAGWPLPGHRKASRQGLNPSCRLRAGGRNRVFGSGADWLLTGKVKRGERGCAGGREHGSLAGAGKRVCCSPPCVRRSWRHRALQQGHRQARYDAISRDRDRSTTPLQLNPSPRRASSPWPSAARPAM
jgi:hypothetical protein